MDSLTALLSGCIAPPATSIPEVAAFQSWGDSQGLPTVALFEQTLQKPTISGSVVDLGGRKVWERNPGGSYKGKDDCHFRNSKYDPFVAVTPRPSEPGGEPGMWRVQIGSTWAYDGVGYYDATGGDVVSYYQETGKLGMNPLPCGSTIYREMVIDCSSFKNNVASLTKNSYRINVLKTTIDLTTVESSRDGVASGKKTWPIP